MPRLPLVLALALLIPLALARQSSGAQSGFPAGRIETLEGDALSLGEAPPRLTVLDFWALWCSPCLASLPEMDRLAEEFRERGVRFVFVNADNTRSRAKLRSFVSSRQLRGTVALDPSGELMRYYRINSLPHLLVLDSTGRELVRKTGYMPGDELLLEEKLSELLGR